MRRRSFLQATALLPAWRLFAADVRPARIAVGQIGATHAHAAGKYAAIRGLNEDFIQAGVAEADPQRRTSLAAGKEFQDARWVDEAALLADPAIRAVVIETTLEASTPTAGRALQAGKHVHLDKPGGADHPAFKAMRLEAERRGLAFQMGYMLRHNPGIAWVRQAVRAGWLGELRRVEATMNKQADPALRRRLLTHPGHGMMELGCHLVDVVVDLLGEPLQVAAKAERTGADALPDRQVAEFGFANATARIACDHADASARRYLRVEGTKGWIQLDPLESR
jgi:predicted dehydrogenase